MMSCFRVSNVDNAIQQVIARLKDEAKTFWPECPPSAITIAREFRRPYSTVYRLALPPRDGSTPLESRAGAYVKIFKPSAANRRNVEKYRQRLQTEFEVSRQLQQPFAGKRTVAVVKPLAWFPELLALVTEETPGRPLAELIERRCKRWHTKRELEQTLVQCYRAGEALALLQQATSMAALFNPDELVVYVDKRLQRLEQSPVAPFAAAQRRQVRDHLVRIARQCNGMQSGTCGSHGDFGPFNILAGRDHVTIIDFSMYRSGSIYNDVSYFCQRLESLLHKPTFSVSAIQRLTAEFLRGYNDGSGRQHDLIEKHALFNAFRIKHLVNNYSALARNRVGGGSRPGVLVRSFHRHVFNRYNDFLTRICRPN